MYRTYKQRIEKFDDDFEEYLKSRKPPRFGEERFEAKMSPNVPLITSEAIASILCFTDDEWFIWSLHSGGPRDEIYMIDNWCNIYVLFQGYETTTLRYLNGTPLNIYPNPLPPIFPPIPKQYGKRKLNEEQIKEVKRSWSLDSAQKIIASF
jgi:hypothetical protein